MYINIRKVKNNPSWTFGSCFKYFMEKSIFQYRTIVSVSINNFIFRMEGFNKIPTVGNKPRGRSSNIKVNTGMMDMLGYEHIKKAESTEDFPSS